MRDFNPPYDRLGSSASILACTRHVCLPSVSDQRAEILNRQLRANAQSRCAIARWAGSSTERAVIGGEIDNSGGGALS